MQSLLQRLLLGNAGGGGGGNPTLNYNFVDGSAFPSAITFTRASTATFFNSSGVLTSAGNDVPRLDYNPATLAAQGLLIEEARTNSLLRSAEFDNASWVKTRATVTANTATAPDGTTSADSIVEDGTAANTHDLRQGGIVNSATTNWTLSFFLKAVNRTWALIELQNATATGNRARAWFNLQTGVVGTGNAAGSGITYVSHSIQNVGNGWYRCVVVGTVDVSVTSIQSWVEGTIADNTSNYDGVNGQTSIYIWGAQLEAGAFPTSYIPTTTTALTRSADAVFVNTLSPWYNSAAGTLYAEILRQTTTGYPGRARFSDGTANNAIDLYYDAASNSSTFEIKSGGTPSVQIYGGGGALNTVVKAAAAWETNNAAVVYDGSVAGTDTSVVVPSGINQMRIANTLTGYVRRVTYYPVRLTNAALQQITT